MKSGGWTTSTSEPFKWIQIMRSGGLGRTTKNYGPISLEIESKLPVSM